MNVIPKILVVDDEIMIQIILDQLINSYGFKPIQATTQKAAEEHLSQHTPDLILLDIMMPDCDSVALLKSIKANPKLHHTRVIMISGTNDLNLIASYIDAGADDYVLKPFHAVLLRSRIMHALERIREHTPTTLVQDILTEVALKLRQIAKENEELDNNITHDINGALTGVMTCSHFLADADSTTPNSGQASEASNIQKIQKHLN